MKIAAKWCGIDFGQCLMNPGALRNPLVFGDIYKELGKPELTNDAIERYHNLKEKYGTYSNIKEGHKDEIMTYVLEGDQKAMDIFLNKEQEHLKPARGVEETLEYLKQEGIIMCIVAEMKKTLGPIGTDVVSRFLKNKNLIHYFSKMVTPQGSVDLKNGSIDMRYKGQTKESGTLYDLLVEDLRKEGIEPNEAVMVGDKIKTDIDPPRQRGIKTVQFTGYFDWGSSAADYRISDFFQLTEIVKGKKDAKN
jgi:FMN phosphatase YigB (HAD superfamily)